MQKNKSVILLLYVCCANFINAQPLDSIQKINPVIITASRLQNFSSGTKLLVFDSTVLSRYSSGNLADLLGAESHLFIKSYGLGSLATSSFRGGGASHTALLWNGFNLNNPMYGQFDLSLIPNYFADKVVVQYGGTAALWGSGAVGGAIHLNNEANFNKGLSLACGSSFGSFGTLVQNLQAQVSTKSWVTSLKVFNTTAENNFPYYNTMLPGSPKQIQKNNSLQEYGVLSENYFKINNRQKINLFFWYQFNDRSIPPIMLQQAGNSAQQDESYRFTSEWHRTGNIISQIVRAAYFNEALQYNNLLSNIATLSHSQTVIAETETRIKVNENNMINIGFNNTFAEAVSYNTLLQSEFEGYQGTPSRNRFAAFTSYTFTSRSNKFRSTVSARQEFIQHGQKPFTYSWGAEYSFVKWFSAKMLISKVYRVPTFNDLYWFPGGNPNLLPESGYCEEAGLNLNTNLFNSKVQLSLEPTVFNRVMDNWIIWLPGQSFPRPKNIMKVWSRGMETKSELALLLSKLKFGISVYTNYVVSTCEQSGIQNDASLGKQIIYVPMYTGHARFWVEYKKISVAWTQSYTGYRYTSTDNKEYLPPYMLSGIYGSYKVSVGYYLFSIYAHVNNFFNEQYQILLNHAMPMINYRFGISIQFNKPINKIQQL